MITIMRTCKGKIHKSGRRQGTGKSSHLRILFIEIFNVIGLDIGIFRNFFLKCGCDLSIRKFIYFQMHTELEANTFAKLKTGTNYA